jgi:hypothetical protein
LVTNMVTIVILAFRTLWYLLQSTPIHAYEQKKPSRCFFWGKVKGSHNDTQKKVRTVRPNKSFVICS